MTPFKRQTSDLFYDAFRTVCWQMVEFAHDRSESLHPVAFNCNRCDRSEKDLAAGCPTCGLVTKLEEYRGRIVGATLHYYGGWPDGWTLDEMMGVYNQISAIAGRTKKIKGHWDEHLVKLVTIYREEQAQRQAVSSFESLQKMKQANQQNNGGIMQITKHR